VLSRESTARSRKVLASRSYLQMAEEKRASCTGGLHGRKRDLNMHLDAITGFPLRRNAVVEGGGAA